MNGGGTKWTGDFKCRELKTGFAETDKCKPVLLRLSLAGNLEKPLFPLYWTEWRERGYGLWLWSSVNHSILSGEGYGIQKPIEFLCHPATFKDRPCPIYCNSLNSLSYISIVRILKPYVYFSPFWTIAYDHSFLIWELIFGVYFKNPINKIRWKKFCDLFTWFPKI